MRGEREERERSITCAMHGSPFPMCYHYPTPCHPSCVASHDDTRSTLCPQQGERNTQRIQPTPETPYRSCSRWKADRKNGVLMQGDALVPFRRNNAKTTEANEQATSDMLHQSQSPEPSHGRRARSRRARMRDVRIEQLRGHGGMTHRRHRHARLNVGGRRVRPRRVGGGGAVGLARLARARRQRAEPVVVAVRPPQDGGAGDGGEPAGPDEGAGRDGAPVVAVGQGRAGVVAQGAGGADGVGAVEGGAAGRGYDLESVLVGVERWGGNELGSATRGFAMQNSSLSSRHADMPCPKLVASTSRVQTYRQSQCGGQSHDRRQNRTHPPRQLHGAALVSLRPDQVEEEGGAEYGGDEDPDEDVERRGSDVIVVEHRCPERVAFHKVLLVTVVCNGTRSASAV